MSAKRTRDGEGSEAPPPHAERPLQPRPNVEMARVIKGQHVHIRGMVAANGGDVAAAWDAALADKGRLQAYATAMRDLAVQYWDGEHGAGADAASPDPRRPNDRYNDRLGYIVGAVRRYFCGVRAEDRAEGFEPGPPGIAAGPLKEEKRRHFAATGAQLSAEDAAAWSREWLRSRYGGDGSSGGPPRRLVVLDVGACYNPLQPRFDAEGALPLAVGGAAPAPVPVAVLGLDIAPHPEATNMCRCDWSRVAFHDEEGEAVTDTATVPPLVEELRVSPSPVEDPEAVLRRIAPASAHVVSFCLLLSYLPTPQMRAACIVNANRALRPDGLLVIVSTRTQGKRKAAWVDEWVAAVESVGFARVDRAVKAKIIGLTFRKTADCPGEMPPDMANKLGIIADDVD